MAATERECQVTMAAVRYVLSRLGGLERAVQARGWGMPLGLIWEPD